LLEVALPLVEGVDREFFGERAEQAGALLRYLPPNNG